MHSAVLRARLEFALGKRVSSPFTDLDKRVSESVSTGIVSLDTLTGGLPRGAITEICGPLSSGRTSAMISILAESTAHDEVCALVDGNDAFDPQSGVSGNLDLTRLLWVRCHKLEQVLKTTDLLLQGGGFGRVVMDLTDLSLSHVRSIPLASWFRFQRAIEKTPTVLIVMSPETIVKSAAALVFRVERGEAEWNIEIIRGNRRWHGLHG